MNLAIAIPTYNEAENIKKLLPLIKKNLDSYPELNCTVFIVDDNSPDKTAKIAKKIGSKIGNRHFKVEVILRTKKEGLGKAYIYAFNKILDLDFDFVLQMDADLSHNPKYLPSFIDASKSADFIVGSRYVVGGSTPDWQWYRKLLSRGGNSYIRLFLGSRISDYTSGFNMYSAKLLKNARLDTLRSDGYEFLTELKYRATRICKGSYEVPIVFSDRKHGKSKIPRSYLYKMLFLVIKLRVAKIENQIS